MRAVWYERQGPAQDVLILGEKPMPNPGPGEVLIRVFASGVNPSDEGMRSGLGRHQKVDPFVIPQSDGAGIVEALGDGVTRHAVGDRVWLYNGQREGRQHGTGAEFISLNGERARALPDNLSFSEGATLGIPCMTAHFSVFCNGPVADKTVLVTGGGGAVGHYAIQWATWGGARVLSTVSSEEKASEARAAGADVTLPSSSRVLLSRSAANVTFGTLHVPAGSELVIGEHADGIALHATGVSVEGALRATSRRKSTW